MPDPVVPEDNVIEGAQPVTDDNPPAEPPAQPEPPTDEPQVDPAEPETPVDDEPVDEPPAEEPSAPSRRESLRIQQLIDRFKQQPQAPAQQPAQTPPGSLDYSQALDADPEVIRRLEADRQAAVLAAQQIGNQRAEAIQFRTMLEIDAPKVEAKYPQLNKDDSVNFNPAVANAINTWYLATAGFDPQTGTVQNSSVRYSDFVEGIMELADEMAGEKSTTTAKNVARQRTNTGLRPDGSSAKRLNLNKPPEQMTDEELAAVLSQAGL